MQDLIITFYDGKDKVYKEIDDKILSNKGNVRDSSDYLFYVILDNIVTRFCC
jgi:Mg2+ and Co2+ transporter CorA